MRNARLILLLSLILLPGIVAEGAHHSAEGTWWLSATGGDGVLLLELSKREGAIIPVAGAGWSSGLGGFYLVDPEDFSEIEVDYRGRMTGRFALLDPILEEPIGSLVIMDGRVGDARERIRLKALFLGDDGTMQRATLRGGRLSGSAPAWTGRTLDGRLSGGGIRSRKYELAVSESALFDFPFLDVQGAGPIRVAGSEDKDLEFSGLFIAAPNGRLFGVIDFDGEECVSQGRVREMENGCRLRLTVCPPERERLKIRGLLAPTD